jgi:CNT family concentrative nucleoside transporter
MGHILTASLINAPVAIAIAVIMVPPAGKATEGELARSTETKSAMDAVTKGTVDGVQLLLNITAMLLVLVALVGLVNIALGLLPDLNGEPLSLQRALGWLMAPVVWLLGVPWSEATIAGRLMGTKTVLNELIAYLDMSQLPVGALSTRASLIMTYAMCGFANFGSLGIMIGGMGTMVPDRRSEIVSLGMRTIVSGTMATCMTGAVVAIVAPW